MGAFIIAGLVFVGTLGLTFLVAFGQGMADAPVYDNTPLYILVGGSVLSLLCVASHWGPHIGW